MKYRAEIDGLRALAVVPVILFHAGFELFSGGYVGVDVFFVISGYLITTILIEDIESNRFSIANFYERRARRILPALFFVMLVCIPFAWMWMLPSQMRDFSQSLVAVSLFASNILFWTQSGYFDPAAEDKPLLHTWSLAVEEQYYLLFPIFLILVWRIGKNKAFGMIVVMAAISLLLSEWGWRNKENGNFFLAPTRAWELLAGTLAAFIVQKRGVQKSNFLALLGLAAIVFSIFAYDENTPFPSLYALVPVMGVVLLVLYGKKETIAARLLSNKAMIGIGLISYSAYLWHQPLFAFARIKSVDEPSHLLMALLVSSSIALAYFSWKFIETPFRNKGKINVTKIFVSSSAGLILAISIGVIGIINSGFPSRYEYTGIGVTGNKQLTDYFERKTESCSDDFSDVDNFNSCLTTNNQYTDVIIVGDSHALHLMPGLIESNSNLNFKFIYLDGNPFLEYDYFEDVETYFTSTEKNKIVVFSMAYYVRHESFDNLYSSLKHNVKAFSQGGHKIVFVTDIPTYLIDAESCNFLSKDGKINKNCSITRNRYDVQKNIYSSALQRLVDEHENISIVDLDDYFCDEISCSMIVNNALLYSDDDHLNIAGSIYVSPAIISKIMDLY